MSDKKESSGASELIGCALIVMVLAVIPICITVYECVKLIFGKATP